MNNQNISSNDFFLNKNTAFKALFEKIFDKYNFNFENESTVVFEEEKKLIEIMSLFQKNNQLKFEILE